MINGREFAIDLVDNTMDSFKKGTTYELSRENLISYLELGFAAGASQATSVLLQKIDSLVSPSLAGP